MVHGGGGCGGGGGSSGGAGGGGDDDDDGTTMMMIDDVGKTEKKRTEETLQLTKLPGGGHPYKRSGDVRRLPRRRSLGSSRLIVLKIFFQARLNP